MPRPACTVPAAVDPCTPRPGTSWEPFVAAGAMRARCAVSMMLGASGWFEDCSASAVNLFRLRDGSDASTIFHGRS